MDSIHIEGGHALKGSIPISGAKNSGLKLMAACLLSDQALFLQNMPRLRDTKSLTDLLVSLGVDVQEQGASGLHLDAKHVNNLTAPYELVSKMRASFNVLGPLLARHKKAKVSLPGGCAIGARPVNLHLDALRTLGAQINLEDGYVIANAPNGLQGGRIEFPTISVGATEHALLSAVLAKGETHISNAAREPEITDLATCLQKMGANIQGTGTRDIFVQGVERLNGCEYTVMPDRIEAGTYALATAMCGGEVHLLYADAGHLDSLWLLMHKLGVQVERTSNSVCIRRAPEAPLLPVDIETSVYPGMPTDLQAQFMAVLCLAKGRSVVCEKIFENRFMHCPELVRMGADIDVQGNQAIVQGVEILKGAFVMATDLRASASLIIAALGAEGKSTINRVYHLDRGFENIVTKLSNCGAHIKRVKSTSSL